MYVHRALVDHWSVRGTEEPSFFIASNRISFSFGHWRERESLVELRVMSQIVSRQPLVSTTK